MDAFRPASRKQGVSKGGLIEIQGPNGEHQSIPTFTCCHCNRVAKVPENAADMGFCQRCHARECMRCAQKLNGRCRPFELKLKEWESKEQLRKAIGEI